jgi:hypothetical protein
MTNFTNTFKAKAHSKSLTSSDMLALCIYRTVKAKSEDKTAILTHFLKKSFTAGKVCAHRQYPYQSITLAMYYLNGQLRTGKRWSPDGWYETNGKILGEEITDLLTEEEEKAFREVATIVFDSNFVKAL